MIFYNQTNADANSGSTVNNIMRYFNRFEAEWFVCKQNRVLNKIENTNIY